MNISLVMAVYNKIELTKNCYSVIRLLYPSIPLVISSKGSIDGTKEWLNSLDDKNLIYHHDENKCSFSENFNTAINLVKTDKLVLIHNDMVIGKYFLENLSELVDQKMFLSYTTIEPPIFVDHMRAGKVLIGLGYSFNDFNQKLFDEYVEKHKNQKSLYNGATFFMCGYKKSFLDVGLFDGETFNPAFCEDDDFLLRARLKGYKLRTTDCAVAYHFVSQTSRSNESPDKQIIELNSNKNFIRKWGMPISSFVKLKYWDDNFSYRKVEIGLKLKDSEIKFIELLEPFFDKIEVNDYPHDYILSEQKNTNFDLSKKFEKSIKLSYVVEVLNPLNTEDIPILYNLRQLILNYKEGLHKIGNFNLKVSK